MKEAAPPLHQNNVCSPLFRREGYNETSHREERMKSARRGGKRGAKAVRGHSSFHSSHNNVLPGKGEKE